MIAVKIRIFFSILLSFHDTLREYAARLPFWLLCGRRFLERRMIIETCYKCRHKWSWGSYFPLMSKGFLPSCSSPTSFNSKVHSNVTWDYFESMEKACLWYHHLNHSYTRYQEEITDDVVLSKTSTEMIDIRHNHLIHLHFHSFWVTWVIIFIP